LGVHQLLLKLKVLKSDDNVHRLKAERDTFLLDPHPPHIVEIARSPHISVMDTQDVGRLDMGGLAVYTVDDQSTTEVDDGLSIENDSITGLPWIHIHIADPTRLFSPQSVLDMYARERGISKAFLS
jgi:exoribonuclease R